MLSCLLISTLRHKDANLFASTPPLEALKLLVSEATHLGGGRIDQAWFRGSAVGSTSLELYSPYYTCKDHDALLFTAYDESTAPLDENVIPESRPNARSLPQRRQKQVRL